MESSYTYFEDLAKKLTIPDRGIFTQNVHLDSQIKVVLFGFSAGEELSEHTASMPAILYIVQGEVELTLGKDSVQAGAGAWVHMPANLQHSVYAKTPVVLLLQLLKQGNSEPAKGTSK